MSVHNWLKNNILWYRKWHEKSYANFVHYFLLLIAAGFDVYLIYRLKESIYQIIIFSSNF